MVDEFINTAVDSEEASALDEFSQIKEHYENSGSLSDDELEGIAGGAWKNCNHKEYGGSW